MPYNIGMLALYRRHRRECKAGHLEDSRSSEYDERKKGWKRCDCPVIASGSLAKKFRRQTTGQWEWEPARAAAVQWEAAGSWGAPLLVKTPKPTEPSNRITISEATEAFLDKIKSRGLASATHGKYTTFIKQLRVFTESKGFVYLDRLGISDMDKFYASWPDGKRAKARKLHKLTGFTQFCLRRKWIAEDIAADLEPPEGHSIPANKSPFSDEEVNRIIAACDQLGGPVAPGPGHREWTGEDIKTFIYVMLYTGMRISDVATFDTSLRLNGNHIFLRMHKTRKELYTWAPDWLVERLREREQQFGPRIFALSKSHSLPVQTERWRLKLQKVFALAGQFSEKPVPHRFRHTFVRILLERGVPVGDVAELVGDTERILIRYYSKWIASRQARLSAILQEAFAEQPTPSTKVVAIR
jgi:integrase